MEASVLLPLWRSGDVESLPDVLAEHATFSSPVADHNGQAKTAHMLGPIARVLEDVENAACSLSSGAACPVVAVIDSALRSAGLPSGRCEPAAGSRSLDSCVGGGGRYRRRRPARRRSATSEGAIPSSRLRVRYSIRFFSLIWCLVMTIRALTCRSVRLPVSGAGCGYRVLTGRTGTSERTWSEHRCRKVQTTMAEGTWTMTGTVAGKV